MSIKSFPLLFIHVPCINPQVGRAAVVMLTQSYSLPGSVELRRRVDSLQLDHMKITFLCKGFIPNVVAGTQGYDARHWVGSRSVIFPRSLSPAPISSFMPPCVDCGLIFKNLERTICFKCEKRSACGENEVALAQVEVYITRARFFRILILYRK